MLIVDWVLNVPSCS
jgi:hypothetical protein